MLLVLGEPRSRVTDCLESSNVTIDDVDQGINVSSIMCSGVVVLEMLRNVAFEVLLDAVNINVIRLRNEIMANFAQGEQRPLQLCCMVDEPISLHLFSSRKAHSSVIAN